MISRAGGSAPAAQLPQDEVGVAARFGDVAQDGRAGAVARVVHDDVAEAEQTLRDGGRDRDVLYVAQGDVARRPRDEAFVYLYLRVGQREAHRVALHVLVGRPEEERERQRERDVEGNQEPRLPRQQRDEQHRAERGQRVTDLDEEERRADDEDGLLLRLFRRARGRLALRGRRGRRAHVERLDGPRAHGRRGHSRRLV